MQADRRSNNLNFIRFMAASIVVYGHGQAIAGHPQTQVFGGSISVIGVMTFFVISGYLITDSWERTPSLPVFFANRCLRIFPALFVVTALSALVLGPAVTSLPLSEYFSNAHLLNFFRNIWLYTTYFLPGLFEHNAIPHAVNGSLWSLAPEFLCYMIVAVVGLASQRLRAYAFLALFLGLASVCFYRSGYKGEQVVFYATDVLQAAAVMVFFMVGAMIRLFRIRLNMVVALALLAGYFLLPSISPYVTLTLNWIVLSYFVLAFGLQSYPVLKDWGKPGDFSYGIYLYAFPIQQTLYYVTDGTMSAGLLIALSFILSLACAYLSWHLIEERALRLKPKAKRIAANIPQPQTELVSSHETA